MSDAMGAGQRATQATATVKYSVHSQNAPIVGKTVKEVRERYGSVWSIPTEATAYSGKTALNDNYTIQAGDEIEFFKRSGEKGVSLRLN